MRGRNYKEPEAETDIEIGRKRDWERACVTERELERERENMLKWERESETK